MRRRHAGNPMQPGPRDSALPNYLSVTQLPRDELEAGQGVRILRKSNATLFGRRAFVAAAGALALAPRSFGATGPKELDVNTPMPAPEWARLQRALLDAHTEACEAFHARYFDERHHLRCFPRWGANDGPDDAIEHVNDW